MEWLNDKTFILLKYGNRKIYKEEGSRVNGVQKLDIPHKT